MNVFFSHKAITGAADSNKLAAQAADSLIPGNFGTIFAERERERERERAHRRIYISYI
jgi:hypothetical protein